jgi:superfamily II DNA or RNA helicase
MQARPHQINAKKAVISDYDNGSRRLIVSMATGTGKTFFFSELYSDLLSRLPGKMLVLAHTEELVDQNIAALRAVYPGKKIDKEMAAHKADPSTADIIVASVASLGRKGTSRVDKYNWLEWDKVIVDEAHHTPAQSYCNVLEAAGVLQSGSGKLLLGVTATTQRADGKALADFYSKISYTYSLRQAIEDGWLVDVRGYRVDTETDLNEVASEGGDFKKAELADKVNNLERNVRVAAAWLKLGENRSTVVFATDIAHAKALAGVFKTQTGATAEAIWGDDPDREQKLADHRAGKIKVLVNVGVLVEGYDDWQIACIVIARPTQSECLFTQMCGRGTRLQEGTGNLKEWAKDPHQVKADCIIIDVVDNCSKHSLMTIPSLMGLPGGLDLHGGSAVKAKTALDDLQAKYPNIDFAHLKSMDEAESYVEKINMFEVRFPTEVEENSELKWCKTVDGKYRIAIPGPMVDSGKRGPQGIVEIHRNMLDQWEIDGDIKNVPFHGTRTSMEDAFMAADNAIRERANYAVPLVERKSSWNMAAVSGPQMKLLARLYPGKPWPEGFTKGQAAYWIDKRIGRKTLK